MTSTQAKTGMEVERLIGEALAKGPTPGEWAVTVEVFDNDGMPETAIQALAGAATVAVALDFGENNPGMRYANACLIAACNPENIRQLLAALAAEREEVERLMGDLRASEEDRLELHAANCILADEAVRMREAHHFVMACQQDPMAICGSAAKMMEGEVEEALRTALLAGAAGGGEMRDALIERVDAMLGDVYHCTRVWSAWQVGTMSEHDFTEARGSSLAGEIVDEILANTAPPPPLGAPK